MKISQAPRGTRQSVLVFGPPKSGKTQLVGELAEHGFNLIWFDLENGHATLFKLPPEAQERIELLTLPDTRSYPIAIETSLKVIKGGPVNVCELHGKAECAVCKKEGRPSTSVHLNSIDSNTIVVFDSLTQLTNSAIANITKGQPDDYKLQQDDWGNLGKLMDIFLSHVQQAKFNIVCISHETEVEMEDGKFKLVATAGTKNFSRNTAKYFGHVIYADVKTMKHKFTSSTTATPNILVGSRTDIQMEKMNEPSLVSIFRSNSISGQMVQQSREGTDGQARSDAQNILLDSGVVPVSSGTEGTPGQVAATANISLAERIKQQRESAGK